ncbi:MAG: lamin tail domain-containing protein [Candidatus Eisenbacteria bacterium]|uniref:Lamin tail domain-containing protein n=1 Tax=Eiseniibacteriota bacterium TaxID=2212470 RepID=A0A849SSU4_UNCEI|nr:lamin tail domain-containing protein [Candidatus Eisenbacteria bacterium]
MRLASALLLATIVFGSHLPVAARSACAESPLRLSEICAGPTRDWNLDGLTSSRDDEWIEVVNTGATPVALDGHLIMDGDSLVRIALTGTLGAGEHRVIFGKESWDWERANAQPAFGFSLGNNGDRVTLWQVVGVDTSRVDGYTFTSHQAAADRSVGRSPGTDFWMLFDALNPYSGSLQPPGTGCAPTPGAPNDCGMTPSRSATWGELKSRYR